MTRSTGNVVEQHAETFLTMHGLKTIERNWHCRAGEIDLVMLDRDTIVFVEVRYRKSEKFGGAVHSIDSRKRAKMWRAAEYYLAKNPRCRQAATRFDVIAGSGDSNAPDFEWIKDAITG